MIFIKKSPKVTITITGIIPKGLHYSKTRSKIIKANSLIKKFTAMHDNLIYLDDMHDWTFENGELNQTYFYTDNLHLVERVNKIFAKYLTSNLPALPSLTLTTSTSTPRSLEIPLTIVTPMSLNQLSSSTPLLHTPNLTNIISFHCPVGSSLYDSFFPTISTPLNHCQLHILPPQPSYSNSVVKSLPKLSKKPPSSSLLLSPSLESPPSSTSSPSSLLLPPSASKFSLTPNSKPKSSTTSTQIEFANFSKRIISPTPVFDIHPPVIKVISTSVIKSIKYQKTTSSNNRYMSKFHIVTLEATPTPTEPFSPLSTIPTTPILNQICHFPGKVNIKANYRDTVFATLYFCLFFYQITIIIFF